MRNEMTSLQRVNTSLSFKEPDRVPLLLLLTYHGAKELDMSLEQYFSKSEYVVKAQLYLKEKYQNDCLNPFFYGALDSEAFGSEVIYSGETPPNCGPPIIKTPEDILKLTPPSVKNTPCLIKCLKTISDLRAHAGPEVIIPGTVISPYSLPIMQMGFDKYIELMYEQPELFWQLMKVNEAFCLDWANAQFEAGADVISYVDPCAASSIMPTELYEKTGFEVAKRMILGFKGPSCYALASQSAQSILPLMKKTGAVAVAAGYVDDMHSVKKSVQNELAVLGNLSGIEMCKWSPQDAENAIKHIIKTSGAGGGIVISESTGEIPFHVKEEVLLAISEAVMTWGQYPLEWVVHDET